jgi:choline dehydrogenase-like flavoprotein
MAGLTYDFIVVGAGPAGSSVAWRLANSKKAPSILVVEAGGNNNNPDFRVDGDRWITRFNPDLNYNYKTVPQKHADDRELPYDRGRGLGGSSCINFCVFNIGPKDDHDEIARLTGDDDWKWENAHERYKRIESYHGFPPDIPSGMDKYLSPKPEDHGKSGPINVGFPLKWEPTTTKMLDIWAESGYQFRSDLSDGQGLGLTVGPCTAFKGVRSTAADMLVNGPSNLHIATNDGVHKVVFEGKRAVAVQTLSGQTYRASKEIILSAGALDTPKILMHSGIGPVDQLRKFNIRITHANNAVGQNLVDHFHTTPTWVRRSTNSERLAWYQASDSTKAAAIEQWKTHKTGPLAEIMVNVPIGFFKCAAVFESQEFKDLPEDRKAHLLAPTTPSYEIAPDGPCLEHFVDPANAPELVCIFLFVMNQQSRGSVTLQSEDPKVPLLYDPNIFGHPFDRRVAIEAMREVLLVTESPAFKKDSLGPSAMSGAPKSSSDEDILEYWRKNMFSTWHMTGTCKVGKEEERDHAVVDTKLKVFGVDGLRIADMSVVPIIPK